MPTYTSFDGATLAYEDENGGGGALVVLLHGFAADTNLNFVRSGLFDALVDAGHRVVAPDARGHGLSEKPHDPAAYADDALRRDVQALLDHLGATRCIVVGYSMGAGTALRLALTDTRPQAIVLLGAGDHMTGTEGGAARQAVLAQGFQADVDLDTVPEPARAFREMADSVRADPAALGALLSTRWPDVETGIDEIHVPVLLITGVDDTHAGSTKMLAARFDHSESVRVPGNHFTANSSPELHAALLAFLERVTS